MNKKLAKASVAGVATLALAAGGTTFAAWSDFSIDPGNSVGADVLSLTVNESESMKFDDVKLAPGQTRDIAFYVASRSGETVPAADLTMTIKNLKGQENGCDSNSEAFAESNGSISDKTDDAAPCNANQGEGAAPGLKGQFADQTLYYVQTRKTNDPSSCNTSSLDFNAQLNKKLSLMNDVPVNLLPAGETLAGGEGVCVLAHVFMPNDQANFGLVADNASQGDSATFDVRFDLTQAS